MPTLVQFGAGNIGRGFIAERFSQAGWSVVFIEINRDVVAALNTRGAYTVTLADATTRTSVTVAPVRAVSALDIPAVAAEIAAADLVATAVGLAVLPRLAPALHAGFMLRDAERPVDILVCENGAQAAEVLQAALYAVDPVQTDRLKRQVGIVRTSIGRMIPAARGADLLDIQVEPYGKLPIDSAACRAGIPQVPGLFGVTPFELELARKLYLHNMTHACLAYVGVHHGCTDIADAVAHPQVRSCAYRAGLAVVEALSRAFATADTPIDALRREHQQCLDDVFVRYANPVLGDPIARVGRDPKRKLASDDRLLGAAQLCVLHGVACPALWQAIVAATAWPIADDEALASEWRAHQQRGACAVVHWCSELSFKDPSMTKIAFTEYRLQAAAAMRAAGLVLRDDEADALEIADFGLQRFPEIGLAIHTYVNTDRCCAKELMMMPGQMCPEHRHPPLDGDPGKEETFRVRTGEVFLYLPGHKQQSGEREAALQRVPADKHDSVTMFRCVHLRPGEQYTLKPNTPHWFVAGPQGAIVSEFSTRSRDEADVFTDASIQRVPDAE